MTIVAKLRWFAAFFPTPSSSMSKRRVRSVTTSAAGRKPTEHFDKV
jgi:hypothetical protein